MATPMSASKLIQVLRAEGLTVREHKRWRTHNRNHKGAWGPINGVMMHHTVSSGRDSSVALCYNGHSALPGPLCHGVIDKNGVVWLVSAGRANHAGAGDPDVLSAVISEKYGDYPPADNEATVDGNARFYGFECINLGDGRDPWPAAQVDAMVRAGAAIARHYGWSAKSIIAHSEWQPGKIDPRGPGFPDMKEFRARIQARLSGSAQTPTPEETEAMPEYLNLAVTKPVTLRPGQWTTLFFDAEFDDEANVHGAGAATFATGGVYYTGDVTVRVSGLEVGAELQVRHFVYWNEKSESSYLWSENASGGGSTTVARPLTGWVGKGHRAGVRVCHYGAAPVKLERAELKALVWKQ